ncbi:hypothetical protein K388_01910 [Streptomyces sp. KhCrAH-43]|uniref:hypothetical protein n=1 Tax=unclassified Streptomyces TaxID=2593676 RepID=UPI000362DCD5|nr:MULTISPECIES: hypothetical protein [unclassified Streptomyces]MYS34911.1 hypothetical protein [Streptomyces sp. SID4920]MYX65312.1 hypothetical protein [Streptomyces sp. SID8373]RAJ64715.1 hypothetical protein K388_01910 [Streptomyces sp. KhCrAH-43]
MRTNLAAAIDTASRHTMAATHEQVPALDVNGGALGALLIGLIMCTVIAVKWKNNVYKEPERKAIVITAIACILLAGSAGGIIADIFGSVQDIGDQVGNSVTTVGTGR